MAVIERATPEVFAQIVSDEEWQSVPLEIGEKLYKFVNEKFEEFITTKALLETNRFNAEQNYEQLKADHDKLTNEFESIKLKLDAATATVNELESQLSTATAELTKLRTQCSNLEAETAQYRHERNLAVDDRDNQIQLMQRRDAQIERMQIDINSLSQQLEAAVNAKCEALAQVDEVASMKVNLEYQQKQFTRERALMNEQIDSLTEQLRKRTEELLNMRRDNTSRCIQLEIRLNERTQDLTVANEQVKSLTEINNNLKAQYEELIEKMAAQKDVETKMNESYMYEIDAKTKMANAYKAMAEESQAHADQLKEALAEVQNLLKTATEKYGELETKFKQNELTHEEILSKKNACIELLKKELATANELLESSKDDHIQRELEGISPTAASASRLLKSGMTITELYSQYVSVCEKLANTEEEYAKLNNYMTSIVREIDEKGPLIQQLRVEYTNISEANDDLKEANDKLLIELQQVREANDEYKRMEGVAKRECDRLRKEVNDLSRQVCHLLNEVQKSRIGSQNDMEMDYNDSVCSADIISKRLVTFSDINELQANNQKLLALVRELSERQEEAESLDPAAVAQLKSKLESVRSEHQELLAERERQNKMMTTLQNQRDMYKNLYSQAVKAHGEEIATQLSESSETNEKPETKKSSPTNKKIQELEKEVEEHKKKVQSMKEEHESYRKEKAHNEKMLLEQMDQMRAEIKELTKNNCKLLSQCELNEEKTKILQNNIEIYKKQIMALEKQNKIFSEAIVKHEQAATYLKDETIRCQSKLAEYEVMVGNLQKENALLRDKEQMLMRDRDMLKRDSQQQNLIQSNIELIKATLDRADAEGKLRLESRLDEAFRECAALRRRLQEEQDTFRSLTEHLKKQTENAQNRMEEERSQADKLRNEVAELREELIQKSSQIEDLTKKLKTSVLSIPESNVAGRRIRELENQLLDAQAETQSVRNILKTIKEASENYCNVAAASETQLKEFMEKEQKLLDEIESQKRTIQELQEKCSTLEGELSVQMDDQDITNASIKTKSSKLEEELSTATMDLNTAREQLNAARSEIKSLTDQLKVAESKYAREMMLHSVDLQALTQMKEELDKVMGEVNELKSARDQAVTALKESKESWANQEKMFEKEKLDMEQRFKDMEAQNSLLLDQIQAINTNLTILQSQASGSGDGNQSIGGDTSFNRSINEDDVKSSEQLLKIIKYLRQEKDIAVNKADIMEAEFTRLKSQFDLLTKQFEETKKALEAEQQRSEIAVVSAAKHAEVLRKLETLNAITDSNRALRQERDQLLKQVHDLKARTETLEAEMAPLQEKNRDLATKADQMQNENISLRAEATRWRQRANMLIEKTNRTSPEDWKRLQTERENLAKQLTVERATTSKLNEEINSLRSEKVKMEEQMKALRGQNNSLSEEVSQLRESINNLQGQVNEISATLEQAQEANKRATDENRILTEDTASKDVQITELKNNLSQIRKIAKKYKTQSEEYLKEIEGLKGRITQLESKESEQGSSADKPESADQQAQEQVNQENAAHQETVDNLNQIISTSQEEIDKLKVEIDRLKKISVEKEDKFKTLFKNAKERIVSLTEQNTNLKQELNKQGSSVASDSSGPSTQHDNTELIEKIEALEREKQEINEEKLQEKEKLTAEIDNLTQRVLQLQRQLGSQQGSKPSTSSGSSEKSTSEPPTANIKPMAGHSTNTQTQSVSIQPWRSGGEPPLASIRPMSAQLRTVAVLPTSQSPSAVMVPPQQQVHTTGSSSIEALSSSPTSSHTDYVPATSSASSAMMGPRQVAVPPTQSSQDTEDDENNMQMQNAPQQQAVALVLPRVEPPSSGPAQEQGTSSGSNTVTTTQAGLKRQRDSDSDTCQNEQEKQQQTKRTRVLQQASGSGLEVEYQVPTSSQRDHDDDNVIVVESDEEGGPDEGEGADDDQEDPDTEGYDMEGMMEQENYEDADCQDVEDEEEGGNEVEVIEDSSEVPNQSERSIQESPEGEEGGERQAQSEAISSGTADGPSSEGGVTLSQASTSVSMTMPSFSRTRPVAPLPSSSRVQQHHSSSSSSSNLHLASHISSGLEECGGGGGGDDGIVPSTPTLFVPRRSDGFGEAVCSPHVPTSVGRFTFGESASSNLHASSASASTETVPEQTLEVSPQMDDNSTGRSVPTTPLQSSPQESVGDDQTSMQQSIQSEAEIPTITVSAVGDMPENVAGGSSMGPPSIAGTSSEGSQQPEQAEQMLEGEDEVSSEGEKPVSMDEGGEEEGREAEASPSTATRRNLRPVEASRRSLRQTMGRGSVQKSTPTPIIWGDPRTQHQQQHQMSQQQMQHPQQQQQQQRNVQDRGRGGFRGTARRSRQRHGYGRF